MRGCLEFSLQVFFHSAGNKSVHRVVRVGKHDRLTDVISLILLNLCAVNTVAVWVSSALRIFWKQVFIDFPLLSFGPRSGLNHLSIGHGLTEEAKWCLRSEVVRCRDYLGLTCVVTHSKLTCFWQIVALGPWLWHKRAEKILGLISLSSTWKRPGSFLLKIFNCQNFWRVLTANFLLILTSLWKTCILIVFCSRKVHKYAWNMIGCLAWLEFELIDCDVSCFYEVSFWFLSRTTKVNFCRGIRWISKNLWRIFILEHSEKSFLSG